MISKIAKTSLSVLSIVTLVFLLVIMINIVPKSTVKADDSGTSVSVSNVVPSLSGEAENPASSSSNPTNVGSDVTFEGTGTDTNGDQYYLALCKSNAITANNNAPPTCTAGNWCISTATDSGVEATCNYTAQQSDDSDEDWWAFACDKTTNGYGCSLAGQGSGDSGSPFYVNHRPTLDAIGVDDSTPDPGQTLTVTTTTSDSDSDTVSLYVCKENDFTGTACGVGGTWCSAVNQTDDPSCQFNVPTPSEGSDSYYGFLIDAHNLAASGGQHGVEKTFTVNNVAPIVSSVILNSGSNIILTENTTTNIVATATATDNNGCADVDDNTVSDVSIYRYETPAGFSSCDDSPGNEDNDNYCYSIRDCVYDTGSCEGGTDLNSTFTCTVAIQYHADPTDANTQYPDHEWYSTVKTCDEAVCDDTESSAVEMNSLVALNVTSSIGYTGPLQPGGESSSDETTTVTATGNVGLDAEYSGTNMTSGGNSIAVSQQKYDLTGGKTWDNMDYTLSGTLTERELNCQKTIDYADPKTKPTYWRIKIPSTQASGSYTGTDTISAYKGEVGGW